MGEKLQPTVKDFLQAGNPCLFLPTIEDAVAEQKVRNALEELEKEGRDTTVFGIWRITSGLRIAVTPEVEKEVAKDLIPALNYIAQAKEPTVAIFYHVRQFLKNPQVIQQVIDSVNCARLNYSTIIFVGPFLDMPPELYNIVTFCECPLPQKPQLEAQIHKLHTAYKAELVDFPKTRKEKRKQSSYNVPPLRQWALPHSQLKTQLPCPWQCWEDLTRI